MFQKIIAFSVHNRGLVFIGVGLLFLGGLLALDRIAINAVPDITNNQVQVVTVNPSLAPEEVERLITYPLELHLGYLPQTQEIRSISRFGLSIVTVVFAPEVSILEARQWVQEQLILAQKDIPASLGRPELMPLTTGLGEIYQYTLQVDSAYRGHYDLFALRSIQDWLVKRQFSGTPGLVEVSSFGGFLKQWEVAVDPLALQQYGLSLNQVWEALSKNNANSGGGLVQRGESAYYIRSEGRLKNAKDIEAVRVATVGGVPVRVADLATVSRGHAPRYGAMSMDGQGEVVGGITLMLRGESSSQVLSEVHQRVLRIQESLPPGIRLVPYLDRSDLLGRTIRTVETNLLEGALVVIFVLVLLLGNLRAGLVVASVIPLSLLFALIMMQISGISANLMSLGAIDFGIVVDGAVIITEYLLFSLHRQTKEGEVPTRAFFSQKSGEIYRSASFGILIILVVFLPILGLEGIEGKMFRPMALTFGFAIIGALLLSLTYVPALSSLVFKKGAGPSLRPSRWINKGLARIYLPALRAALQRPRISLALAITLLGAALFTFSRLGQQFIPKLEEGDLAAQMTLPPGSGLEESLRFAALVEARLLERFPNEVKHVVSKIGSAEIPTDPMAVEEADLMILLHPPERWTNFNRQDQLIEAFKNELSVFKGIGFEFTQPIQLRFNELITGAKTDVAVKIFGDDLETLQKLGQELESIVASVPGVGDVKAERASGMPQMKTVLDQVALARYGIDGQEIRRLIQGAFAGTTCGVIIEGQRQYDLVVRFPAAQRKKPRLEQLQARSADGKLIPVSELARVEFGEGPAQISREQTQRRLTVGVNIRSDDLAGTVESIQTQLRKNLALPPGYYLTFGGEFENLRSAKQRLLVLIPLSLGLILLLLYLAFRSWRLSLLIFVSVPFSAVGGIFALALRGLPFSISAGVGFIALFGVAVLNGLVLLEHLRRQPQWLGTEDFLHACLERLRPVTITASAAALGFLPMALSTSAGAEVQRPLATVVIGGLVSAAVLTMLVLPILYRLFFSPASKKAT